MNNLSNATVGSKVWTEDPEEAWIDGEAVEVNGDEVTINCTSGKTVTAKLNNVYPKDTDVSSCGVDDMTKLAYLHEPGVLQNLLSRFMMNEIYTYTGNILIAVNPFQRLPHLYNAHMMEQYKGADFGELAPHPFAIADAAYRRMMIDGISQSILVSGESGAGKTESTKMLMRFLAHMGGKVATETRSVEQQILESNPVLEAFGNAKTVRNNNSSRFGKFVEIQFDEKGRISGAAVRTYLLERSRVCQISEPERNYHCFYMLCAAPPEDIDRYKLDHPRTFRYLNQSNCFELDGLDESEEYLATRRAMDVVGISTDEQLPFFILEMLNLQKEKKLIHLCDKKALEDSLCKRIIITRGESITKNLNPEAATLSRDSLAKVVYSLLFDWLVNKINCSIGQDPDSKILIGVLDIYGFESFKTNSITVYFHSSLNNFQKPGGIIALLDEACMMPRSTHETFAEKLYQTFKNHQRFTKPKFSRSDFTIRHYAGDVTYQTELFLDKNKDYVVAEHQELLGASRCPFVAGLFPPLAEESSKSSKFSSIGLRFKQQLQTLLETLSHTEPHYVRCVKPNSLLRPAIFENRNVLQQLRCGGVLEAIRISCAGYPTRRTFDEFVDRFGIFAPDLLNESGNFDEVTVTKKLLEKVGLKGYQIGKTKVFLRAGQMAELDAHRSEVLGLSAKKIQRKVRSYLARKHFILLQKSAIQLQTACRGCNARQYYESMCRQAAALIIQAYFRMHLARKMYTNNCLASITIQSGLRGMVAREEFHYRKQTRAATIIQSYFRRHLAYLCYLRLKKATITMQCAWRGRVARRELRKLKLAAKEAGALQEAKNKLEKQVEELTWRLQLEKRMRLDLEEAKSQEITKLQIALQDMQLQVKETQTKLVVEQETSKKTAENASLVHEVQVIDIDLMNKATAENEKLKLMLAYLFQSSLLTILISRAQRLPFTTVMCLLSALLSSLETQIQETEKKFEDKSALSEERLKKILEAESKIAESEAKLIDLKTSMRSLQEKLSNMESENQVLRQQALMLASAKNIPSTTSKQNMDNISHQLMDHKDLPNAPPPIKHIAKTDSRLRRSYVDRQHENVDILIKCVVQNIGFDEGKPAAAVTIYKSLLHWKLFEAEKTSVFDRLIQMIGSAIESATSLLLSKNCSTVSPFPKILNPTECVTQDDQSTDHLAYWLSNSSTLLHLLQKSLKASGAAASTPRAIPPTTTSLFGRMTQGFRSSSNLPVDGLAFVRQVEAKYPALLFKQQLSAYVEKIFGILRDSTKKELSSLISQCLQVIFQKYRISFDEIVNDLCPVLSVQELYRICTQYYDDKYNSQSVSPTVLSDMSKLLVNDSEDGEVTFLLDDDLSIPFSLDEVSTSVHDKDLLDVKPPEELLKYTAFQFLQD
ncbi:hypothetical protein ZIOFF_035917 [Zingiber officinale]|uniref:Uncharacterized protein n=1 Tax=Zingiber officinale TaxID=94328 RepID=A0A8J5GAJ0_ZINOF|nr:hypothetical protein ZIOFF_035917 [Zingiber officinale]